MDSKKRHLTVSRGTALRGRTTISGQLVIRGGSSGDVLCKNSTGGSSWKSLGSIGVGVGNTNRAVLRVNMLSNIFMDSITVVSGSGYNLTLFYSDSVGTTDFDLVLGSRPLNGDTTGNSLSPTAPTIGNGGYFRVNSDGLFYISTSVSYTVRGSKVYGQLQLYETDSLTNPGSAISFAQVAKSDSPGVFSLAINDMQTLSADKYYFFNVKFYNAGLSDTDIIIPWEQTDESGNNHIRPSADGFTILQLN